MLLNPQKRGASWWDLLRVRGQKLGFRKTGVWYDAESREEASLWRFVRGVPSWRLHLRCLSNSEVMVVMGGLEIEPVDYLPDYVVTGEEVHRFLRALYC